MFLLESLSLMPLIAGFVAVVFVLLVKWFKALNMAPLPPGPRPLPIIGNMFDMPKVLPWVGYREWSKIYGEAHFSSNCQDVHCHLSAVTGDIVYLHLPAQPTVVLGSVQAAIELLDRRSAIYSSRPTPIMDALLVYFLR